MDARKIEALGPALGDYLEEFGDCFGRVEPREHLRTYVEGQLSDLPRKSIEPIALAAGIPPRTLQQFLSAAKWQQGMMRDRLQQVVARDHAHPLAVGVFDETSYPKKGERTPGVKRQYCGATGKTDNCVVSVHLAYATPDAFGALLDGELFLPEDWAADRQRCRAAGIPDEMVHRPKWRIALELLDRAVANGVRFPWVTFDRSGNWRLPRDEWYGGKPGFLDGLGARGLLYVCEVPANLPCFPSRPKYKSLQRPFAPKRVDSAGKFSKPFKGKPWKRVKLARKTLADQVWEVRSAQVYLARDGRPTDRTYWLIVARSVATGEVKYFVSNAPPRTGLLTLLKVAFTRAGVEHVFRLAKTEVGFSHFEGRNYQGLVRHMTLCQLVLLFAAEQTDRLRGEKPGRDDRADGEGVEHAVPRVA